MSETERERAAQFKCHTCGTERIVSEEYMLQYERQFCGGCDHGVVGGKVCELCGGTGYKERRKPASETAALREQLATLRQTIDSIKQVANTELKVARERVAKLERALRTLIESEHYFVSKNEEKASVARWAEARRLLAGKEQL